MSGWCDIKINIYLYVLGIHLFCHKEYHTSLDNKEFTDMKQLALSCTEIFDHLVEIEKLAVYTNILGHGEPQLGKYDLYPSVNSKETRESYSHDGMVDGKRMHNTLMTLLCHSDGKHSTTDVAKLLGEGVDFVDKVAAILRDKKIIKEI